MDRLRKKWIDYSKVEYTITTNCDALYFKRTIIFDLVVKLCCSNFNIHTVDIADYRYERRFWVFKNLCVLVTFLLSSLKLVYKIITNTAHIQASELNCSRQTMNILVVPTLLKELYLL